MKDYFLDTSFLVDLIRNDREAVRVHEKMRGHEVTGTPCIYELAKFSKLDISEAFAGNEVLRYTQGDAEASGSIYCKLKDDGDLIGEIDVIIAGMVKNRDLVLMTRDTDFEKIDDIEIEFYG